MTNMITVIAEKPSVGKDIALVLGVNQKKDGYFEGNGYFVTWSFGHLSVLVPPEMYAITKIPIIPSAFKLVSRSEKTANGYEADISALKQLKVIKYLFERSDSIICATDASREGENIFRNIYNLLDCKKPFSRLWISSLTDKAIMEGFQNLKSGSEYDALFYAAEARSHADWLIGINASRSLSMITGDYNNSLGRVQTPTLAMVCARYNENRNFKPVPFWDIKAGFEKGDAVVHLNVGEKFYDKAKATEFYNELGKSNTILIKKIERKQTSQEPPLLYDLTSLQQDANRQYGFSADQTLNTIYRYILYQNYNSAYLHAQMLIIS
jgi:DNA topoisomerase-3